MSEVSQVSMFEIENLKKKLWDEMLWKIMNLRAGVELCQDYLLNKTSLKELYEGLKRLNLVEYFNEYVKLPEHLFTGDDTMMNLEDDDDDEGWDEVDAVKGNCNIN